MRVFCRQVFAQPYDHGISQGYHAIFLVLALANVQRLALEVDVRDLEVDHFLSTQTGRIDEREHNALFE